MRKGNPYNQTLRMQALHRRYLKQLYRLLLNIDVLSAEFFRRPCNWPLSAGMGRIGVVVRLPTFPYLRAYWACFNVGPVGLAA